MVTTFTYSLRNKDIVLTKELLDKNPKEDFYAVGVNKLVVEEGVTSFDHHGILCSGGGLLLILPTSIKDLISPWAYWFSQEVYVGFKPVLIDGEKVSSFTVCSAEREGIEKRLIVL